MPKGLKLNIPKRLLAQNKNEERSELIAVSICIKGRFGDSLVKNYSIRTLQNVLSCGFKTAQRLYHVLKNEDEFFYYNEKTNTLLAKDFKKKYTYIDTDRKGRLRWSMYSIKIDNKHYTLREAKKLIKECLFLNAVNAIERKDEFLCKSSNKKSNPSFMTDRPLTQKRIAKMCGLKNKQAAYRMVKDLERRGIIKSEKPQAIFLSSCASDESIKAQNIDRRFAFCINGFLYSIKPKTYHFTSYKFNRNFCNTNFNHKKRYSIYEKQRKFGNEEERKNYEYFQRMEH